MRVTFLLPGGGTLPAGGFKVVYEYANALAQLGHQVTVVHPAYMPDEHVNSGPAIKHGLFGYVAKAALRHWRPDRWFAVDPLVRMLWIPSLRSEFVPDADVVVATWWLTAEILANWPATKGEKFYLLQHLETWGGPEERVLATWRLPLKKIVIARWLEDIAKRLGEPCCYIPNGLNFAEFDIDISPVTRCSFSLAMLYHQQAWKGSSDGIAALQLAKSRLPQLQAEFFGTSRAPAGLPTWISYRRNPRRAELRAIYNRSAIFLAPSWEEGWPLPPAEALLCGCALACTDIGGHREYVANGVTALTCAARDPAALARNIVRLMTDDGLRLRLAAQGRPSLEAFTWQRAVSCLQDVLADSAAHGFAFGDTGRELRAAL